MNGLRIEQVENGFIVHTTINPPGFEAKTWVFNDAVSLGKFIEDWALCCGVAQ